MIETERFILKKLTLSDANDQYLRWFCDQEVKKFIVNHPQSTIDLENFIAKCNKNKLVLLLGIFTKHDTHIGNIKFEFDNMLKKIAVMGIMIGDKNWRGKAVASEVICQSAKYLTQEFNTKIMTLGVDKGNYSAVKAYEKIGFRMMNNSKSLATGYFMEWLLPLK